MEQLQRALEVTRTSRNLHLKVLNTLSLEQLNTVPKGYKNSLFWNFAHIVVTQQLLVYGLSQTPLMVSDKWVTLYKKGSIFTEAATEEELTILKELLIKTIDKTEKDLIENNLKPINSYMTSTGFELKTLEDVFLFNNFHEGIHFGYILAMKKTV